ncbi:MAG: hypothetical protein R3B06_08915 [Kofleriaceae bacterium]
MTSRVTAAARIWIAAVAAAGLVGVVAAVVVGGTPLGHDAVAVMRGWWGLALALALAGGAAVGARGGGPGWLLTAAPRRWFVAGAVVVALASAVWAHHAIHHGVPDVPDELGYLHTARTFAAGHLTAPSPPAPEFFYVSWGVHDHGQWYAVFPPGYGVLLAAGTVVGAAGWVNPILGALLVIVLFLLAEDLLGRDSVGARVCVLLYLASWFRLMNGGSFMAHPTAALAAATALLGVTRGLGGRWRWAVAGGASLGFLLATRQLDAIIVAAALAPVAALAVGRAPRVALARLALIAAAALPLVVGYLAYNRALTGAAFTPPQQRYMQLKERRGDCFRLGFGPGVGECPLTQGTSFGPAGFQPRHAVANTRQRLDAWVRWSSGWTPLVLLPLVGLGAAARRGGAAARGQALVAGVFVATVGGYALFFYHGVIYGARFYYVAWPITLVASAAAVAELAALPRWRRPGHGWRRVGGALAAAFPVLLLAGLATTWPSVRAHAGKRPRTADGALVRVLAAPALADALVFVDSMTLPATVTWDPVHLERNHPLVVKDLGDAADAGLARLYPGRRPLRLQGRRLVPLALPADAPMRHEAGALYPLDDARGGFGDRTGANGVGGVALSGGEALRFAVDRPGASFSLPVWAIAADAGAMTVEVAIVHHPGGPPVELALDDQPLAAGLATAGARWEVVPHRFAATLAPGRHRLVVRIPDGRRGQVLALDYVELRRR